MQCQVSSSQVFFATFGIAERLLVCGDDAGYYLMDQVVLPDQVLDISAGP